MANERRDFEETGANAPQGSEESNFRPVTLPSSSRQSRGGAGRPFVMPPNDARGRQGTREAHGAGGAGGAGGAHGARGAGGARDPRGAGNAFASDDPRDAHDGLVRVKKKRKKQGRALKICLGVLVVVLVLIVGSAGALIAWVNSLDSSIGIDDERERTALLDTLAPVGTGESKNEAVYVAILGSDARSGDSVSRSDVVTLVRIDETAGVVDLISIPRDTMVNIEGHGTQKINAAYSFGGAAGAVSCISEFAGVPINHYVEVHFDELETVVDKLGGIWVDVPESFSAGNGGMSFTEGQQRLNGEQALAFARERYNVSGGDFGRAQAQRLIIMGIVDEVLTSSPATMPGLIGDLAQCVTTDYSVSDMVHLALQFQQNGLTMYSAACPSYSLNVDGISYVGTEYAEWRAMMQRVDAGLDPNDTSAAIPEEQARNEALGAASNGASPRDYEQLAANAGLTTGDVA